MALQSQQMEVVFNDVRATLCCDVQPIECKSDVFPCGASGFVWHKHTDVRCDTVRESFSGKGCGKE
jgi:hypothetical protein